MTETDKLYAVEWDSHDPITKYLRLVRYVVINDLAASMLNHRVGMNAVVKKFDQIIDQDVCGGDGWNPCEGDFELVSCRPWAQCDDCHAIECGRRDKEAQAHGDDSKADT